MDRFGRSYDHLKALAEFYTSCSEHFNDFSSFDGVKCKKRDFWSVRDWEFRDVKGSNGV